MARKDSSRGRSGAGRRSLGVVREIDARLDDLDRELETYEELVAERERLRRARAQLTGEQLAAKRISQDELVEYLEKHPGSRAKEIAGAFGVPLQTISSHLYRAKLTRFESRPDGWYLRAAPVRGQQR
jgi:DNA-directed RNA polymerase specialized sigma24 family protein